MDRRSFLIMGVGAGPVGTLGTLGSSAWAAPPSSDSERFVTPEEFGGPQVKNSIVTAMAKAAERGLPLKCAAVDYITDVSLVPARGLHWHANGCRIVASTNASSAAIRILNDDVRVHGLLRISLSDPGGTPTGYRGHVLIGDWTDGSIAPSGFEFDDIELEGGHQNVNGFAVAGGAHQVRGNSLRCGDSDKLGRLFLAHWGNFSHHKKPGALYEHAKEFAPTMHPHAISIKEIAAGRFSCNTTDFVAVAAVSGGYDIDLGKVSGVIDKPSPGPSQIVLLTAGDLGLAYATPAERSRGMWGIRIGSIEGHSTGNGITRIGQALYHDKDSTPQPAENYFTKIEDTVARMNVVVTGKLNSVLAGFNGFGRSRYGMIEAEGGRVCVGISNYNRDTVIETVICRHSFTHALEIGGAGGDPSMYPQGITISSVQIDGTDAAGSGALANKSGIVIQSAQGVRIGHVKIVSLAPGGYAGVLGTNIKNVQIGDTQLPDNYDGPMNSAYMSVAVRPDVTVGRVLGRRPFEAQTRTVDRTLYPNLAR
jgi:hypothetical protein